MDSNQRAAKYIKDHPKASVREVVLNSDCDEHYARGLIESADGRKDDEDKVRLELIPPEFIFAVGSVLTFGAIKYEDRNWEKGMSWGRVFGASLRHLMAWWGGKRPTTKNFVFGDLDTETGMSHLWHAACCICFLVTYEERAIGKDDRNGK